MKKIFSIFLVFIICIGILVGSTNEGCLEAQLVSLNYDEIKDKLIRFHVIANSDSDEDQAVKLLVRDKVIDYINPVYLEIAAEIIKEATNKFQKVNHDILIPLADHIHFTIKRMDENIMPSNPFTYDIRLLFPDEYEVALKSKEIIKSFINKEINNDEVSFITLHIHSAISSNKVGESMEAARIVHESIIKLQTDLNIKIDIESISYARLMNHIKFLIIRLNTNEQLQMDISEFTKNKFPFAYEQAIRMCDNLSKVLHKELPESEVGYLALHLERILSSAFQN